MFIICKMLFVIIDLHLFNKLRGLVTMSVSRKQKTAVSASQPLKLAFVSRLL
jgi:hypothetical protein